MTGRPDERVALTAVLQAQRRSVLAIVGGLPERDLRRPVTRSGWTLLGMIEHLAHAERFWFRQVIDGTADPLGDVPSGQPRGDDRPFTTTRGLHDVLAGYREQVAHSDQILAATPLDARPAGPTPPAMTDDIHSVRDVVLHMIEETARHAGPLDIARELPDGKTGPAPR